MNDLNQFATDDQSIPPLSEPAIAPPPHKLGRSFTDWLKRLFVCNPFYLVSAALLLYGVHRISVDGGLFVAETSQLLFNFSALQIYEVLLALTATLLITRRIWYEATLLVALENMLWVVPFILVSQAAFIAPKIGMIYCAGAVCLMVLRAVWLRYRGGEFAPSARMLWCGLPVLIVNAVWPVLYRRFGETKIGVGIPSGAAYDFNEFNWFWLLPMLVAILLLLPRVDADPKESSARRWFPLLWLGFWLAGTSVHLYALGYVYDFDLRREQLAPTVWALAWALHFRLADFLKLPQRAWNIARLFLPVAATTLALAAAESRVFFYLSALNFVGYGILLLRQREDRLVLQLSLVSFAAMVAALPIDFAPVLAKPLAQTNLVGLAALTYVIVGTLVSRNPMVAILGALATPLAVGIMMPTLGDAMNWAIQAGLVYFLLHSLRWEDDRHIGARAVRWLMAILWVVHGFCWIRGGGNWLNLVTIAGTVMLIWTLRVWWLRRWELLVIPAAAVLVALCGPANFVFTKVGHAPAGLLYVVGSFALFGVGTLAALTKHRWHKPTPTSEGD
jgi:hypothetical protein